jgi:hypothetical protein
MLRLLLPALIPSWRFFDTIGPSPRLEFALLDSATDATPEWREFRPRPARMSLPLMLLRLFWNPRGNESLYLGTCAERLLEGTDAFREQELISRITRDIEVDPAARRVKRSSFLRVRASVVRREQGAISRQVLFVSAPHRLHESRDGTDR